MHWGVNACRVQLPAHQYVRFFYGSAAVYGQRMMMSSRLAGARVFVTRGRMRMSYRASARADAHGNQLFLRRAFYERAWLRVVV